MSAKQRPPFLTRILDNNRTKVETRLAILRDKGRLAIHCFEDGDANEVYPDHTMHDLMANEKAPLAELLCDGDKAALFSMTLLPKSGKSVNAYSYNTAYLFDLSVGDEQSPPRVVRVFKRCASTGKDRFEKDLKFQIPSTIAQLHALYANETAESFKAKVAQHPTLSTDQLDRLAAYYDLAETPATSPPNEVVAAVRKSHIAAIAMPFDPRAHDPKPVIELRGALAGLAHLTHGMDLPVVLYHTAGDPLGACTYLAQGKEECTRLAVDAIRALQQDGKGAYLDGLWDECEQLLGIDVDRPIDKQPAKGRV